MRLIFNKGLQKKFLNNAMKSLNLTSDSFSKLLGISRATLYNYLSEKYNLPENLAIKIFNKTNIDYGKYIIKKVEYKFVRKKISLPKSTDPKLAEFIGILLGDGHLGKLNSEISITCNLVLDYDYMKNYV